MKTRPAFLIVYLASVCAGQVFQPVPVMPPGTNTATNVISGKVRGSDGSVISSGVVTASRLPGGSVPRNARTSAIANILADGSFRLPAVANGTYQLCTQTPATQWLNACEWGGSAATVLVPGSQTAAEVSIVLTRGALVSVRVNDPAQLLAANEGKTPGAHLLLGLETDAHFFQPASVIAQDSGGRTYQLLMPFDRSIRVSAGSTFFHLSNALGSALPQLGNIIPVQVASGQAPPTLVLNITGTAK